GQGADVLRTDETEGMLDLGATLRLIAARGITRVFVEGGPTVAGSLVSADLVDEATLLRGPVTIGPDGIDALEKLPLTAWSRPARATGARCLPSTRRPRRSRSPPPGAGPRGRGSISSAR